MRGRIPGGVKTKEEAMSRGEKTGGGRGERGWGGRGGGLGGGLRRRRPWGGGVPMSGRKLKEGRVFKKVATPHGLDQSDSVESAVGCD